MKLRWLGGALAIALAIVLSWRAGGSRPEAALPPPTAGRAFEGEAPAADQPRVDSSFDPLPSPPARDIFRYAEAAPPPVRRTAVEPTVATSAEPPALPPPPLHLVGFVRRPEGLRAAVATASGVVIVGPGDLVLGHTVLSLDEDRGLRLRAPDGAELILPAGH